MPAAAWPGTVQRYSYVPERRNVTLSVFDCPGETSGVLLPVHVFAVIVPLLLEQTLKS